MNNGFLKMMFPQIFYFADEGATGGATATPPPAANPEPPAAPANEPAKAPEWPVREETLNKVREANQAKKTASEGAEPPTAKGNEPAPETPKPAEPKKEYVKPDALLSDIIEGFNFKDFEGKTVKDFAEIVKDLESTSKSLESMKQLNEILQKNKVTGEELAKIIEEKKKQETPDKKEIVREDFDTEEEFQAALKKAEAERANEERLRKLEEKAIADENEKFRRTLNESIDSAIKKHSDEASKTCYLSNDEINTVLEILGTIPNDVPIDVISIMNKAFDVIGSAKKSFAEAKVKEAVEKSRPEHIKEYLALKTDQQQKFLEANGQTPAPSFAQPEKPLSGEDFETGRLKDRVLGMVRELRKKK